VFFDATKVMVSHKEDVEKWQSSLERFSQNMATTHQTRSEVPILNHHGG